MGLYEDSDPGESSLDDLLSALPSGTDKEKFRSALKEFVGHCVAEIIEGEEEPEPSLKELLSRKA